MYDEPKKQYYNGNELDVKQWIFYFLSDDEGKQCITFESFIRCRTNFTFYAYGIQRPRKHNIFYVLVVWYLLFIFILTTEQTEHVNGLTEHMKCITITWKCYGLLIQNGELFGTFVISFYDKWQKWSVCKR